MPKISIVVPLHNKGRYIADTLQSLQAQTFTDWEALVVENNSDDDGPARVAESESGDSRIRLIQAPPYVRGPCGARNLGVRQATGEWILFLDADDLIEPDHLRILCELGKSDAVDIVAGGWKEFVEGDAFNVEEREGPAMQDTSKSVLDRSLACAPWAVHAALIHRKWLGPERCWPMEMERHPSEDSVFWFRALVGARLGVSLSKGAIYRKETAGHRDCHGETVRWAQAVLEVIRLNESWLTKAGRSPSHAQAACVVRTLEALYLQCQAAQAHGLATVVLAEAERWLLQTSLLTPSLALRRIVGIEVFRAFRRAAWWIGPKACK